VHPGPRGPEGSEATCTLQERGADPNPNRPTKKPKQKKTTARSSGTGSVGGKERDSLREGTRYETATGSATKLRAGVGRKADDCLRQNIGKGCGKKRVEEVGSLWI